MSPFLQDKLLQVLVYCAPTRSTLKRAGQVDVQADKAKSIDSRYLSVTGVNQSTINLTVRVILSSDSELIDFSVSKLRWKSEL